MPSILQVEGGHPLHGEITVRGAKNFVPKAMVASLLADTPSELYNVPLIRDTDVVSNLLSLHGVEIDFDQDRGTLRMDTSNVKIASRSDIDTLAGASRIPILFCGPLLHQLGELGPLLDRELHISAGHVSYDGPPHIEDDHEQHHGGGDHCHPSEATAPSQGDRGLVSGIWTGETHD